MEEKTQSRSGKETKIDVPVMKAKKGIKIKSGEKFEIVIEKEVFELSI